MSPASEPATPYLRVDLAQLRRNISAAADRAAAAGVVLRPHAKTHKCPEIARLQVEAGAVGLTVATIGEAEVFVDHGVADVLIAYPLWLSEDAAARLRAVAERATVTIGVDSVAAARHNGALLADAGVGALVEVDCGQHRSGAAPGEAGVVALAAAESGLDVRGVLTFPGHGYSPDGRAAAAADEARALRAAVASLREVGLDAVVVSGGSTPTLELTQEGLTELRPGVYVFGDAQQWELGVMSPSSIALACRTSVVSHAGGRLVLDSGSKALGADRAAYATGWGRLPAYPDARVVQLSEHHAVVDLAGAPLPTLGSRVDVVPNHVCNAVNLADTLWVDDGTALVGWLVAARGRNA